MGELQERIRKRNATIKKLAKNFPPEIAKEIENFTESALALSMQDAKEMRQEFPFWIANEWSIYWSKNRTSKQHYPIKEIHIVAKELKEWFEKWLKKDDIEK